MGLNEQQTVGKTSWLADGFFFWWLWFGLCLFDSLCKVWGL